MDLLTGAALINELIKAFLLLLDGIITKNKQVKEKLVKLHFEILDNKTQLKQSGLLNTNRIAVDDKTFINAVKKLSNYEIKPLFKFNKRGIVFSNSKKAVQRRKTQYSINYVVTQIDWLKTLIKIKRNKHAPIVRLSVRLKTLYKHLETLEKILRQVK